MGWPQIILIVMWSLSLGIAMQSHGEHEIGKKNAWHTLIGAILTASILYWGGFWNS